MNDLVNLPYEIQIVIVAGYFAYKVYTTGRNVPPRTEDFLLQVLAFGLISRILTAVTKPTISALFGPRVEFSDELDVALLASVTILYAIVAAAIWRKHGNKNFSDLMSWLKIYRDDHEHSTLSSLIASNTEWNTLQIHLSDGRVLESHFPQIPTNVPCGHLTINDDGIAMYVTATYSQDLKRTETPVLGSNNDYIVTYIPRSEVRQMEITWKQITS